MNEKPIREALRRWDPATKHELSPLERECIRRAVLNEGRFRPRLLIYRLAAAVVIVAFAGLAGLVIRETFFPAATPSTMSVPADAAPNDQKLQIHYATPGGTRIVWTMDPAFSL